MNKVVKRKEKQSMEKVVRNKRMIHYDLLRIVAAFSVVILHSASSLWYSLSVSSREWQLLDVWDASFRFGVPIFVMISGTIFLSRDIDIKRLYTHNILRLLAVYWVWSAIYGLYDCRNYDLQKAGWKVVAKEMFSGRYHLWFLPMIIGIYMLLPILRSWVKKAEKQNLQYFLVLFFCLKIVIFTAVALRPVYLVTYVSDLLDLSEIGMVCSYIGYFVWGYYISHYNLPEKWRKIIYACVVPAILANIYINRYLALKAEQPIGLIYDSYGVFTFLIVTAIFLFFTNTMSKVCYSDLASRIICEVSASTLGIYVMHVGLLEILDERGITNVTVTNIAGVPLLALLCFIACAVVAACLRRIPLIGRFLC